MKFLVILMVLGLMQYTTLRLKLDWVDQYLAWARPKINAWVSLLLPLLLFALIFHHLKHWYLLYFVLSIVVLWYGLSVAPMRANAFAQSFDSFSIVFWFVLLGPFGVLLYDFISRAQSPATEAGLFLLEWPAARVLALGYALAGYFPPAFAAWVKDSLERKISNEAYLEKIGQCAFHGQASIHDVPESDRVQVLALVKRAQIMLLFLLALVYLGMWL